MECQRFHWRSTNEKNIFENKINTKIYRAWDATYPDIECTDLRRAIAQKEGIAPEQILCGNGASELLMAVVRAAAPEKCAIAAPSFSGYERAVRAAGAEPVFYELSHDTGFGYETVCDRLSKMTV